MVFVSSFVASTGQRIFYTSSSAIFCDAVRLNTDGNALLKGCLHTFVWSLALPRSGAEESCLSTDACLVSLAVDGVAVMLNIVISFSVCWGMEAIAIGSIERLSMDDGGGRCKNLSLSWKSWNVETQALSCTCQGWESGSALFALGSLCLHTWNSVWEMHPCLLWGLPQGTDWCMSWLLSLEPTLSPSLTQDFSVASDKTQFKLALGKAEV